MKRLAVITVLWLLASTTVAWGDEDGVKKYKDYTPTQIKELPQKVISSELPIMYSMAAQRGLSEGSEILFGMELNKLMYPGLHDYKRAVREFQADMGDKETGILTVWQIHNLEQRAEMQSLSYLGFPDQFSDWITDDYAAIQGTMIIQDDKIAWPINHVKLNCNRSRGICEIDQLVLTSPNEKSWTQTYQVYELPTDTYNISSWSESFIDASPIDPSGCRVTSLSLNFETKEFYQITRNGTKACETGVVKFELLTKPRISKIVDGEKIFQSKFGEIKRAAFEVLSSSFRKKVQKYTDTDGG